MHNDAECELIDSSDIVPFGRFHYQILALCGFGWATDNMWLSGLSFQRQSIVSEYGISNLLSGVMASLLFAGLFAGASFWGYMSDRRGRVFAFTLTLAFASGGAVLTALMPLFPLICIALFILGSGAGGNLPVDGALFAEFTPSQRRGFWMVVLAAFWPLGGVAVTGLCWATIGTLPLWLGWRVSLAANALLCAVFFFFRRAIPETPRFLLLHGRIDEAEAVVRQVLRSVSTDLSLQRLFTHANRLRPRIKWSFRTMRDCARPSSAPRWRRRAAGGVWRSVRCLHRACAAPH
jgi:putative MFS transporter